MVDVLTVRSRVGEALVTLGTSKRLLSCVKSHVFGQVVLVLELLVAPIAPPGSFI